MEDELPQMLEGWPVLGTEIGDAHSGEISVTVFFAAGDAGAADRLRTFLTARGVEDVLIEPVVSEKSYDLIDDNNTYTFIVDPRTNKTEIKQAIESIFEVKVTSVNTMIRKGKQKRTGATLGRRKSTKRALVTLADGDSIDVFEV